MIKTVKKEKIKYITISLPIRLIADVSEIINLEEYAGTYTSYTEFIRETVRSRIREIKALKKATDEHTDNL